jgi:hypothetical protein
MFEPNPLYFLTKHLLNMDEEEVKDKVEEILGIPFLSENDE